MADFGTPVAGQSAYDPMRPLQTLSAVLNLKRQQVGLQQQQQELQSQTAAAYQATQSASERQALSQVNWKSFLDSGDIEGAQKTALAVAPTTGADFSNRFTSAIQDSLAAKSAAAKLNQQYLEPVRNTLALWAADGKSDIADLATQLDAIKQGIPKGQQEAAGDLFTTTLRSLAGPNVLTGAPKTAQEQKSAALMFSRAGLTPESVSGTGGLTTPAAGTVSTGAQVIPTIQANRMGAPVQAATAPPIATLQQPPTIVATPAGPLAATGGARGTSMTPLTPGTGQPNLNLTKAEVETQTGTAAGITDRVRQAQTQANTTVQTQDALQRALALLQQPGSINTGVGFDNKRTIMNLLAAQGFDTKGADDMNTLVKNLARYEAARATAAGLGHTDAARDLAHNGSPQTAIDNSALLGITRQSLATEKAIAAYANKQSGTADPNQMLQNEKDFRNIPRLIQGYEYGMSRNPQEAEDFLRRNNIDRKDMKATRQLIQQFESGKAQQ